MDASLQLKIPTTLRKTPWTLQADQDGPELFMQGKDGQSAFGKRVAVADFSSNAEAIASDFDALRLFGWLQD